MIILAGDVGGTKTNMAFFQIQQDRLVAVVEAQYSSRDYASFDDLIARFLSEHRLRADRACFGVAGPCQHGRCQAMNLPWVLEEQDLRRDLQVEAVHVINDLEATAYSISVLTEKDFATLNPGSTQTGGNAAVIAAGTGLGQAGLYWDGKRHHPFACEGGHSDFAPRNELEAGLFLFLRNEYGEVEWERVLSGSGIHNLYRYLRTIPNLEASPEVATELLQKDPASVISRAAMEKRCEVCEATLELFVSLYGAEAGNLALKMMATGGVYIAGGIAPKILPMMLDGLFTNAFSDKARVRRVLEPIPLRVILSDKAPLIGAAQCARIHSGL